MKKNITIDNGKFYTFRKLNATDIFAMSKLISKIGIRDFGKAFEGSEIAHIISSSGNDLSDTMLKTVGVNTILNIADILLANLGRCEQEVYTLLSRVSNMETAEIAALSPADFTEMLINFCKKEELRDFILAVSKLTKKA